MYLLKMFPEWEESIQPLRICVLKLITLLNFRIGDMGEFSTVFAIRSTLETMPSICIRGIKLQHLKDLLKLEIDFGKDDAEMDLITINFNKDKVNVLFGECKVN